MKKSELKEIIKECVRETLFEDGILSDIIAEVAFGVAKAQSLMVESKEVEQKAKRAEVESTLRAESQEARRAQLLETKKKMAAAIGSPSMKHVFEGTEPLKSAGTPGQVSAPSSPMSGIDPKDSGVDISGLFNLNGRKWQQLKE